MVESNTLNKRRGYLTESRDRLRETISVPVHTGQDDPSLIGLGSLGRRLPILMKASLTAERRRQRETMTGVVYGSSGISLRSLGFPKTPDYFTSKVRI